jgi:CBS domain containing-hemolysin-like protein
MAAFIYGLILGLLALIFWALYKTYQHVPLKELKRMARAGDELAVLFYRAVSYGIGLRLLLSLLTLVCALAALALFTQAIDIWLAALLLVVLGVVGYVALVPSAELTRRSLWLARACAPAIVWILERLQPVSDFIGRTFRRLRPLRVHTGLYEKSDLADLLQQQKHQPDNRISAGEIDLLTHALTFGDKLVGDVLVPKRVVTAVSAGESIGPVLAGELHKSGHSRFPVYEGKRDNIVGILYLHDLVNSKKTGTVTELMSRKLTYVHEDFTLYQTLQAFLKTKQHLFLVVNSFEEYVGVITIEDVLEQVIGKLIVDEFDRYDDLRAVAAAAAKKDHQSREEPEAEHEATSETKEVVK